MEAEELFNLLRQQSNVVVDGSGRLVYAPEDLIAIVSANFDTRLEAKAADLVRLLYDRGLLDPSKWQSWQEDQDEMQALTQTQIQTQVPTDKAAAAAKIVAAARQSARRRKMAVHAAKAAVAAAVAGGLAAAGNVLSGASTSAAVAAALPSASLIVPAIAPVVAPATATATVAAAAVPATIAPEVAALGGVSAGTTLAVTAAIGGAALVTAAVVAYKVTRTASPAAMDKLAAAAARVAAARASAPGTHVLRGPEGAQAIAHVTHEVQAAHDAAVRSNTVAESAVTSALHAAATAAAAAMAAYQAFSSAGTDADVQARNLTELAHALDVAVLDVSTDADVDTAVAPVDTAVARAEAAFATTDGLADAATTTLTAAEHAVATARTAVDVAAAQFTTRQEKQRAELAEAEARKAAEEAHVRARADKEAAIAAETALAHETALAREAAQNATRLEAEQRAAAARVLQARLQTAIVRRQRAVAAADAQARLAAQAAAVAETVAKADAEEQAVEQQHRERVQRDADADAAWRALLAKDDATVVARMQAAAAPQATDNLTDDERVTAAQDAAQLVAAFVTLFDMPPDPSLPPLVTAFDIHSLLRQTVAAPSSAALPRKERYMEAALLAQLYHGNSTWPAASAAACASVLSVQDRDAADKAVAAAALTWAPVLNTDDAVLRSLMTFVYAVRSGIDAYVGVQTVLHARFTVGTRSATSDKARVKQWRTAVTAIVPRVLVALAASSSLSLNDMLVVRFLTDAKLDVAVEHGDMAAALYTTLMQAWRMPMAASKAHELGVAATTSLNALSDGLGSKLPAPGQGTIPFVLASALQSALSLSDAGDYAVVAATTRVCANVIIHALYEAVAQVFAVAAEHAQPMPLDTAELVDALLAAATAETEPKQAQIPPALSTALQGMTPLAAACASVQGTPHTQHVSRGLFGLSSHDQVACAPAPASTLGSTHLEHIYQWQLPLAPLLPLTLQLQALVERATNAPRPLLRTLFAHVAAAIHGYSLQAAQADTAAVSIDVAGVKAAASVYGAFADAAFMFADRTARTLAQFAVTHLAASEADAAAFATLVSVDVAAHARRALHADTSKHAPAGFKAAHVPPVGLVSTLHPEALAAIDDAALAHALEHATTPPPSLMLLHTVTLAAQASTDGTALAHMLPRLRARQWKRVLAEWRVTHANDDAVGALVARYTSSLPGLATWLTSNGDGDAGASASAADAKDAWQRLQLAYTTLVDTPDTSALYQATKNAQHEYHRGLATQQALRGAGAWRDKQDAAFLKRLADLAAMAAATTVQVAVERAGRGALPFDTFRQLLDLLVLEDCSVLAQTDNVWEGGVTDLVVAGANGAQICGPLPQDMLSSSDANHLWQRRADTWLVIDSGVAAAAATACRTTAVYSLYIAKHAVDEARAVPYPYQAQALQAHAADAGRLLQAYVDLGHSAQDVRNLVDSAAGDVTPPHALSLVEKAAMYTRAATADDAAKAGAADMDAYDAAVAHVADALVGRAVAAGCMLHVQEHSGLHLGLLAAQLPDMFQARVEELRAEAAAALDELGAAGPHGASAKLQALAQAVASCHTWLALNADRAGAHVEYADDNEAYPYPTVSWGLSRQTLAVALAATADLRRATPKDKSRAFELALVARNLLRELDACVSESAHTHTQGQQQTHEGLARVLTNLAAYLDLVYRGLALVADTATALRVVGEVAHTAGAPQLPAARGYATAAAHIVQPGTALYPVSASAPAAYSHVTLDSDAEAAYILARLDALSAGNVATNDAMPESLRLATFLAEAVAPWAPNTAL